MSRPRRGRHPIARREPARPSGIGLTLLESMVALAIVAIAATLALPSLQRMLDRYHVRMAAEALTATLYLARSEAIRHAGNVVLARSGPPGEDCTSALPAGRWDCGWQLFIDRNSNGVRDGEEPMLQQVAAQRHVIVQRRPVQNLMRFDGWGNATGLGAFSFAIRPARDAAEDPENYANATLLCVSAGGRIRAVSGKPPPC
ncbi:GspH/FimT family protein [Lampropedia cohaerens]|uniref:GspH/FimT family protein n=1 Tax=Lampropedia cohaerens TaxID=1610491 RepID=UPI0018D258B1|nr:GspH/FimT family protein [Lampropedia cohaerens]